MPTKFLDLGGRDAVDKALSRLTLRGTVRRLARGVYDYPQHHSTLGLLFPTAEKVAKALAGRDRTRLQPAGAYAANLLGLSEQVPAKVVFLTDGPSRMVRIGGTTIQFRQTTPRNMAAAGRLSGSVIQALRHLGKQHLIPERIAHLRRILPAEERRTLLRDLKLAPAWMHPHLRQIAAEDLNLDLGFLKLPPDERMLFFEQAAQRRGLSPVMLEKDFWVCWILGALFDSKFGGELVFKGGTSLSKVFGVIQRFSEDIDLSLSPGFLGLSEPKVKRSPTRTQSAKWMAKLEAACAKAVDKQVRPELERMVAATLGKRAERWLVYERDETTQSPVLLFRYPSTQPVGFDYLRRSVKLEFGSLTDQQPKGRHRVRPWIADVFPEGFADWRCEVVALEMERTFWEKATILHIEFHRPSDKATPERYSRHYADLAAMARHEVAGRALAATDLRERVVAWKSRYFGSGWTRYDLAKPGTFNLAPPHARRADLARDYSAMRDMYFSGPVDFEQVLASLVNLEQRINGKGAGIV